MSMMSDPLTVFICAVAVATVLALYQRHFQHKHVYPPGPRPLPLVGNIFDITLSDFHVFYAKWKELYGGISYFTVCGRKFVVVNDVKIAHELFEKRSSNYCTRPSMTMATDLVGRYKSMLFTPYGDRFKAYRRLSATFTSTRALQYQRAAKEEEFAKFLLHIIQKPEDFARHINNTFPAVALKLLYGYQVNYEGDRFVELSASLSKIIAEAVQPGRWLVDSFPSLRYIPSWLPGAGFKRWAAWARKESEEFTELPYVFVKKAMATDSYPPSFTSDLLTEVPPEDEDAEDIIKWTAASLYNGATDTTNSFASYLFLLLTNHPDVQARAQEELDGVIGTSRLPNITDRDSLPYIQCIIQEVLRVTTIVPLIPYSPLEGDVYNGYFIPKGAVMMNNVWAMTHDANVYRDPHTFNPDRYCGTAPDPDPIQLVFGFGRRRCPGSQFALESAFLLTAKVLWAFNLSPELDAAGQPMYPKFESTTAHVTKPKPFKCVVRARSLQHTAVIEEVVSTES